jgi:hypothetical protein
MPGIPAGTGRAACLADVGSAGTVMLYTLGVPGDPRFVADSAVVSLMTIASTFSPPS